MAEVRQPNNKDDVEVESLCQASTSKDILNENNEGESWSTRPPSNLKTPVSKENVNYEFVIYVFKLFKFSS
ncbi:hypothetical protein evm_009427 [Chilo suppressalis]|nr:hypothetical protein evm_009427 [Chilo suppressalis]